jgi:hypothetical protein
VDSLLCDLVKVLARSTALQLRQRAADTPLTRTEVLAVATLLELAGGVLARANGPEVPPKAAPDHDLAQIEHSALADLQVVEALHRQRSGSDKGTHRGALAQL